MSTIIKTKYQHRFGPVVLSLNADGFWLPYMQKPGGQIWRVQGFAPSSSPEEALKQLDDYQGALIWLKPEVVSEADKMVQKAKAQELAYRVNAPYIIFVDSWVLPSWKCKPRHPGAELIPKDKITTSSVTHYTARWYVPAKWFMEQAK